MSAWALLGVICKTSIQELVDKRVTNLHISNRHIHNVCLREGVFFFLARAFKWVLFHHKIIKTAAKGPNIDCSRHLSLPQVELRLLQKELRGGEGQMPGEVFTFEQLEIVVWETN